MLGYFGLSLFVSATLLFLVQPMIGKMILPQLGGTPAVWNTCMVFFQAVLLIGYGYTHLLTTTQPTRRQVLIQGCLLFLPFVVLPFSLGEWTPPPEANPVFSLLGKLTIMVALPFFLVSTTAPLLQKWFFHTGHPAASDPYFLYGASNFGSMLGLALYPTVVEPWLPVSAEAGNWHTQVHLWTAGYALFVALVIGCAVVVWQALAKKFAPAETVTVPAPTADPLPAAAQATAITAKRRGPRITYGTAATKPNDAALEEKPALRMNAFQAFVSLLKGQRVAKNAIAPADKDDLTFFRRFRWVGLAAAASSLMLGVTSEITLDIAAIAFFWIIPLALYLLTFIIVFARWPVVWTGTPHMVVMFVQPCLLLLLVLKMIGKLSLPENMSGYETVFAFVMHLAAFFATTLMCHGELAKDRPSTKHLTEFYFWMSLGGVLGGLFNALFAPIFFQHGIAEYPIAMAFACLLRSDLVDTVKTFIPRDTNSEEITPLGLGLDLGIPLLIGGAAFGFCYWAEHYPVNVIVLRKTWLLAYLVILTLALSLRPIRFGLAVGALFLATTAGYDRVYESYLYEARGFFGLLRVRETPVNTEAESAYAWGRPFPRTPGSDRTYYEWKVERTLIHGGINHGRQIVRIKGKYVLDKSEQEFEFPETEATNRIKRREPTTYFHQRNGVAELFYKLAWRDAEPIIAVTNMTGKSDARLPASMVGLAAGSEFATLGLLANTQSEPPYAVLGLGTGILACYAKPYQRVDIYEIDPLVKNLSIRPGYVPPWDERRSQMPKDLQEPTFLYVHDAQERWANIDIKLGDGRLRIQEAPEKYYHAIALDAFSSDAIPVHLLTKEAVQLYLSKLADGGVLLFNTTNRYVRIEGVLAAIAEECDCDCLYCPDFTYETDSPDRFSADWIVLQPRLKDGQKRFANGGLPIHERLEKERVRLAWNGKTVIGADNLPVVDRRWREIDRVQGRVWTDSYSNMLNPQVMPWIAPWRRK